MPAADYGKNYRLLTPGDFKAVFDDVNWKASTQLLTALCKKNSSNNARLGVIISKKNYRLAVQRNRIKRLIRESFRHDRDKMDGLDIVVLVRKGFQDVDNRTVTEQLTKLWKRLQRNVQKSQNGSQA